MNTINQSNTSKLKRASGLNKYSKRLPIIDDSFKIKLKPHQEALLYRILELDDKASKTNLPFGIISDKPGSGKTYVILGLIYYAVKYFNSKGANIIVVPHNIYKQWINSINDFLGKALKYICLLDYKEIQQLYVDSSLLYSYDIIITTPMIYDSFASTVNSLGANVRRVFFDEADSMKNLLAYAINSNMTWFVSASISSIFDPVNLRAKIGKYELYLPKLLENECYCDSDFIDLYIKLPKPHIENFICKNFYLDIILSKLLNSEQLKYISSHDYSNIRVECGGNKIKNFQNIIKYMFEHCHKIIAETTAVLKELEKNKVNAPDTKAKTFRKKQIYTERRELIIMLAHKYNLCMDCFSNTNIIHKSPCNIILCNSCFNSCSKEPNNICCLCDKIHNLDTWENENVATNSKMLKYIEKSEYNKFVILDNILDVCDNKIIIYSEFSGLRDYLQNYFLDYNVGVEELNAGNIKDIDNVLTSFKDNPDTRVLLIDNPYFGVGLNIEYATDLIFFHDTNNKIKSQIVGRAQRFGRKSILNIWNIFYQNEIN